MITQLIDIINVQSCIKTGNYKHQNHWQKPMQNQQGIEKSFFEQLKSGDYVDARYGDDDWKVAKVIDRENRYLSLIYDGFAPNNQQVYINPMRVKPLRAVTTAYTGPARGIHFSLPSIPQLIKHTDTMDTILKSTQPPSPFRVTQFLRGEFFCHINMLLMSDWRLGNQETIMLNNFFIQVLDRIGKICVRVREFMPEYFQANANTKFAYLTNFKLALVWSLQQLLYLANLFLAQNNQMPRLLKNYKNQISQPNLYNSLKSYLPTLVQLLNANDINGRWLPTFTRLNISRLLIKYKEDDKFLAISYNVKDYLEYYSYWPAIMQLCPTENNEKKLIEYVQNVMCKQSPFDAKLKSLVMLRKILEKEHKLVILSVSNVVQLINSKKIVDSLLKYFNPQIFKRYIPILKITGQYSKKTLTQPQIDDLFKIMKTSHESDIIVIYEIIVSISEFIGVETLDNIYMDIEQNIDINNENGIKFVRDFTIKAIQNFNTNKNKGFFSALIGRKKNSSKFGFYGLDLLFKQIQDGIGKIEPKNIAFVISNIGVIFLNESFHQERMTYMQTCITNIDKRQSYGQSVKLLGEIICTYPSTAYIGDSQESIVGKLDDKHKLVDTLVKGLKPLQKQSNNQGNKIKVKFELSIKYCYSFIEQFNPYLKHPLQLRHINHLWHMPFIFEFLRKSKENLDSEIPSWKKKYYKKLSEENVKGILMQIIKSDENIIPTEQCFDAIHELILAFNFNKSLQLTERATIRYKNLSNVIGLNFYFKFLQKLILIYKSDWKKNRGDAKTNSLVQKTIRTIFQIHLRPNDYLAIETKCQNWMKCLMRVVKSIYKENAEICVNSIELFLELIRGRLVKDISAAGKLQILVSYEGREKTIILPKNMTILKLRNSIMESYKIKWNFQMFNTSLKRQIKFIEEQDFSVYAMGVSMKGPTIIVKKVQEKQLYPQCQACQKFMTLIQSEQQFYKIVFGLLQSEDGNNLHARIWKIIEKIPVNRVTKQKIKNCKDFTKKDWQQFLLPTRMEQLQYSINIVESLLKTVSWMEDFKKTEGNVVIEELYLTMLGSTEPLSEKIKINLSKILLKILEHGVGQDKNKNGEGQKKEEVDNQDNNMRKISLKIMQFLQKTVQKQQKYSSEQEAITNPSIQCLNLMMKMLISASLKKNCPQPSVLTKYFLHGGILINISDLILFEPKDIDTTFFTQDILERITLQMNLQPSYKNQILCQFLKKYLNYQILLPKKSTQNYFLFLIDFLHSMDKPQSTTFFTNNPKIILAIKSYIDNTLAGRVEGDDGVEPNQEMIHGCFKLLNETINYPVFQYDVERIFNVMLENFVLTETIPKQNSITNGVSKGDIQSKSIKTKVKSKKILYEIMKSMIYNNQRNLNIFVDRVAPKLQNAEWRRNIYTSWMLQQQKKEKKFFCGLENLAATCYINCLFQQLFMIKRFTERFINIDSLAYKELQESNQIYQLQKLLVYLKYGNKRSYTTRSFCESFITYEGAPIDPTVQNDADEFFNALMEKIEGFLKSSGHHSILEDTFEGKLSNQLNCQGCPHSSEKIETFLSIGLDIKNKKTLEAALDGYVQGEILDGDNAYFCEKCQKKVRTMKRLCIKQVPNILVVVLKRFSYNFDQMRKIKINDELKYPAQLNIKKYTSQFNLGQQCKPDTYYDYKLRGVVIHSGTSEGGHYYSFIKDEKGDKGEPKWYEFNDESIEEAEYKRIQEDGFGGEEKDSEFKIEKHKSAYILFYSKQTLIEKESQKQQMLQQQPFETQLAELVKSQNLNSDFLSIILDQLFIRLCENIAMCGHKNAHHFIILYFHSVLLRDKNKEEYLANVYRILLTLVDGSGELALWFLRQVNQNYVREFLIEAPKTVKYLCLGLVVEAVKVLGKCEDEIRNPRKENKVKVKIQPVETQQNKERYANNIPQEDQTKQAEPKTQEQHIPKLEEEPQTSLPQSSQQPLPQSPQNPNKQIPQPPQNPISTVPNQQLAEQTITEYQQEIKKLIVCLLHCLKNKGMSPYAKIFTYLSSISMYRLELQKYEYAERVAQIILASNSQFFNKIPYQPRESFLGQQNPTCKEKELQVSYSFLIESLRYHPSTLTKQQILNLLSSAQSRPSTKSLTYLLTKTTQNSEQMLMNLQIYKLKLMDDKYKREDIQRFMFMIRYYYLMVDARGKKVGEDQYVQSIKTICMDSLAAVIKSNQNSYMLMEIVLIQINKIAFKCEDFALRWMEKVNTNQGLFKALNYWVSQSRRPHFLQRCEQWKRKTANLSYQQKDQLIAQNQATQEERTSWMFRKREERIKLEQEKKKNKKLGGIGQEINMQCYEWEESKKKQQKQATIPEIHSELQFTEINKTIVIGFRSFKIVDRLGILTKIEDEKGLHRWAILERSDIQTYIDL